MSEDYRPEARILAGAIENGLTNIGVGIENGLKAIAAAIKPEGKNE